MAVTGTFTAAAEASEGSVFGNLRAVIGTATMTGGTGDFTVPLKKITGIQCSPQADNGTAGGFTFSGATITVVSAASGAVFNVMAVGV